MIFLYMVLVLGVGTLLWSVVGVVRFAMERGPRQNGTAPPGVVYDEDPIPPSGVAVLIAAHNEESGIEGTIASAAAQVPRENILVVSDGSRDGTVEACKKAGVRVLALTKNRGKAGALLAGIEHFEVAANYEVVILLDADTRLSSDYLETGLPPFRDSRVAAVAGRVITSPHPAATMPGRFLIAYRERFYQIVQLLQKYGQAWASVNVVSIVPGFASMYRTNVLSKIDVAAPGLVIEDFNMTFEVHAHKLGRIHFHPETAVAYTQDPDNFGDYVKQIHRWNLGFWQTVRRHGLHPGKFWAVLALQIVELLSSGLLLCLLVPLAILWMGLQVIDPAGGADLPATAFLDGLFRPEAILLGVLLPDFVFTVFVAIILRRPVYLLLGLAFPLMRIADAVIFLVTLPKAWYTRSSGTWTSPARHRQEENNGRSDTGSRRQQGIPKADAIR